jgi:diaminohydroxyphosphoribosylaminopyrimidine deaminase/5-amino-6-(5-phosphoribosylamino)uracil reductase
MYVSLEPCAHYGKTPPCANRLVAERVKRVVICNEDPFKEVSGRGIEILQGASVDVQAGILEKEGLWVNRRFFCFHSRQRPYIVLKWAQTADGYFAPADGSQLQISNEHSKQLLHKWRTEEGAILVGTNTALADNPNLTARLWEGKQPLRIVIDKELKVPASYNVYNSDAASWIINEKEEVLDGNVHRIKMDFDENLPDKILARLYEQKILSVIIEGGAAVLNSFIEIGLWDEARIFKSNSSLQNGMDAPLLKDHVHAFTSAIGDNVLEVYTHAKSGYAYVAGVEL